MDEFQSSLIVQLIPDSLLDVDKTSLISRQTRLKSYNKIVKMCEDFSTKVDHIDQQCSDIRNNQLKKCKKINLSVEELRKEVELKQKEQEELEKRIMTTKALLSDSKQSEPEVEAITGLVRKLDMIKEDFENKKKALTNDMDQFKLGIAFYKKYLQCNVIYEPKGHVVVFSLDIFAKTESEASIFIKFTTHDNGISYDYLEMHPKLIVEGRLVKRFKETRDIQEFILSFWKEVKSPKCKSLQ